MKIAKIVSSNSHIDYIGRVIDELDANDPPRSDDYGFGQFVSIGLEDTTVVGVIYNSLLINPEYANFGPRLSPKPSLENFSPDFLNEQGILLGILLIGTLGGEHGIPRRIVSPGADVEALNAEQVKTFHTHGENLRLHYYSQVIAHTGVYAVPLLETIIDGLSRDCSEADGQQLSLLKQSLAWQRTMGGMKF